MFHGINKPIDPNDDIIDKLRRDLTAYNVMNEWVLVTRMLGRALGVDVNIEIKRVHEDHIVDRPRVYACLCRLAAIAGALAAGSHIDLTKDFELTSREKRLEEERNV